jgi:hypothetical protein
MIRRLLRASYDRLVRALPSRPAVQLQYFRFHRRLANLDKPETFTEKIQSRKLGPVDPRYVTLSNKVDVKQYVADLVGSEIVIPTLWAGHQLPATPPLSWGDEFVVKANHASGWNAFVRGTAKNDWDSVVATAHRWVTLPWAPDLHEPWYNMMERQILVEPFIGDGAPLNDYKFFVFDGKVACIQVDTDRFSGHRRAFFDSQWNKQPFAFRYPVDDREIPRPRHFDRMIEIAEVLGANFDFVRIDLYDLPDGPKFGEMTFSPESGHGRFSPVDIDLHLGRLWRQALPTLPMKA